MRVLLIATVQSHICQFHRPLVKMLHEQGAEVHVAARNNLAEKNGLKLDFVEKIYNVPFQRSPFSGKNLRAYRMLKQIIRDGGYDVIHCNTPVGGVLGRLAALSARKNGAKVIYTAHGFHFYQGAPIKNWLIWYPVEKFMSRFCEVLITITEEDYRLALSKFPCRVEHIHGVGVDSVRYHPATMDEQAVLREALALRPEDFVILCVGELNANKNQDKLISAAALLKDDIPDLKVLLAGNGAREAEYRKQIEELGLEQTVRMIGYRTDLERITPAADVIASCSRREGLPLNILEAMLCKKPVIASINRGHRELVDDGETGFLVDADDVFGFADAGLRLYQNEDVCASLGAAGLLKAGAYTSSSVMRELKDIYFL